MLCHLLQRLIDTGQTTVAQLARVAGVSNQAVYNWMGDARIPEHAIRGWMEDHPIKSVRAAVLAEISDNTACFKDVDEDLDLDYNRDGAITLADALSACIKIGRITQASLQVIHNAYEKDPTTVSVNDIDALARHFSDLRQHMTATEQIATQEVSRRRQAREV